VRIHLTKLVVILLLALLPGAIHFFLFWRGAIVFDHYPIEITLFLWPGFVLYLASADTIPLGIHFVAFGSNVLLYLGLTLFLWTSGSYRGASIWVSSILVFAWGAFLVFARFL